MQPALAAPDFWITATSMLERLRALVGAATCTVLAGLARKERALVLQWLNALELMVRKLLLIEAAALAPALAKPRRAVAKADTKSVVKQTVAPSFVLLPASVRAQAHAPAPRIRQLGGPLLVRDIWAAQKRDTRPAALRNAPPAAANMRLANRIAALIRVVAHPLRAARRLARLMKRCARRARIAWSLAFAAPPKSPPGFADAASVAAGDRARRAAIHFESG